MCATVSSFVTLSSASGLDAVSGMAPTGVGRSVKFRNGTVVSALGQGSAGLAHERHPQAEEGEALRTGLSLGMTLIDTAESYGSEELIGRAIAKQRDRVFIVSKVSANHVGVTASHVRVRPVSLAWVLIIWISICCIAQMGLLISPALNSF